MLPHPTVRRKHARGKPHGYYICHKNGIRPRLKHSGKEIVICGQLSQYASTERFAFSDKRIIMLYTAIFATIFLI